MCGIWVEAGTAQTTITATEMPDANLRAAVLARLKALNIVGSTATTFTDNDMADSTFTSLDASEESIANITGLSYATSLITLRLYDNQISTIPTDLPTTLTTLELQDNSISDISALSSLISLKYLNLGDNIISDISVLSSLTNLIGLELYDNTISGFSALSGLTNLLNLNLRRTNISNISVLSGLTNLQVLNLYGNKISDISVVSSFTDLHTLYLGYNKISDISPVLGLTMLQHLGLQSTNISDMSVLSGLTGLYALWLADNNISDIPDLSGFTNLQQLDLQNNKITTTDTLLIRLLTLTSLLDLYLGGNRITDVAEFQRLSTLPDSLYLSLDSSGTNHRSLLDDPEALRAFLYVPPPSPPVDTMPPVEADPETPPKRKIIIYECPVGWQRTDRFAQPNPRVLIYEVKLKMDLHNRISIYKPNSVAIYVHPDEALENLDGWKLKVAIPYNHHRDYLLTAENAVVVDSQIEGVEGGFAFIESPEEAPFPMVAMGFTGATVPGFDYRLYDDTGRKVDFGIACYKRVDIFQVLKDMENPRVLRNVLLETLNWEDALYIRSEWTVPTPAPAAPSLIKKTVVGTWANLKKQ